MKAKPEACQSMFSSNQKPFHQTKLKFTPLKPCTKKTDKDLAVNKSKATNRLDRSKEFQVDERHDSKENVKEISESETEKEWHFVDVEDLVGDDAQSNTNTSDNKDSVSHSCVEDSSSPTSRGQKRKWETTDSEGDTEDRLELEVDAEGSGSETLVIKVEPDWDADEESCTSPSEQLEQPSTSNSTPGKSSKYPCNLLS